MSKNINAILVLSASLLLSACSQYPDSILVGEWECDSHIALTFKNDGAFKIVSTASQQGATVEGQYAFKDGVITIDGPVMAPLSHSTKVSAFAAREILLKSSGNDVHACSRTKDGRK